MNIQRPRHVVVWGKHNCAVLLMDQTGVLEAGELALDLALDASSDSNCVKEVEWLTHAGAGVLVVSTLTFVKVFDLCGPTPLTPTHSFVLSYELSHIQNVAFVPATSRAGGVEGD